jgi:hypothetical protein
VVVFAVASSGWLASPALRIGAPYTITLAAGATYSLDGVDNYWFGPDGLPPVSSAVTIVGNDATIARASASRSSSSMCRAGWLTAQRRRRRCRCRCWYGGSDL